VFTISIATSSRLKSSEGIDGGVTLASGPRIASFCANRYGDRRSG
jgi:hypothetical protein